MPSARLPPPPAPAFPTPCSTGILEFDRATRGVLDELTGVLQDVAQRGPYAATPLLLMAVLVEGGLGGTLAALLQVRMQGGRGRAHGP